MVPWPRCGPILSAQPHKRPHSAAPPLRRPTDAKGTLREMLLPRGLDLERPKRARTSFTAEQLYRLELHFQRCRYVVGRERSQLAGQLGLSETQVRGGPENGGGKPGPDPKVGLGDAEVLGGSWELLGAAWGRRAVGGGGAVLGGGVGGGGIWVGVQEGQVGDPQPTALEPR